MSGVSGIRWANSRPGQPLLPERITPEQIKSAALIEPPGDDSRQVNVAGRGRDLGQNRYFTLQPQDAKGDGTVSPKSGAAPKGKPGVKRVFKTQGYDHQGSYNNKQMALLTRHLIAKMVAEKASKC